MVSAADEAPVRVIRMDDAPPVRSQAVYHAVGHAFDPATTPDTVLLVRPGEQYVSIGYHQELEREVDTGACRELGLTVVRREVGGGAVLLDSGQVFTQWVFAPPRLPSVVEDRFELYSAPLVDTYRELGIDAVFRPVNDLHVAGRKIGGTGAARMSDAEVVVGSLMFDFDHDTMARVLRVSSEKMRDKVAQALHEYVTTMRRELGATPDRDAVVGVYVEQVSQALGRPVVMGELTAEESAALGEWEARMSAPEWTARLTHRHTAGLRISGDVTVHEVERKAPAGLVRGTTTVRSGHVDDVQITGDFTVLPGSAVADLEKALVGCDVNAVAPVVQEWLAGVEAPGLSAEDIVAVLDVSS